MPLGIIEKFEEPHNIFPHQTDETEGTTNILYIHIYHIISYHIHIYIYIYILYTYIHILHVPLFPSKKLEKHKQLKIVVSHLIIVFTFYVYFEPLFFILTKTKFISTHSYYFSYICTYVIYIYIYIYIYICVYI